MEEEELPQIPLTPPNMGLSSEGALQYQFENPNIVQTFLHIIRGEVKSFDSKTAQTIWIQKLRPMVNEKGVGMIQGYLLTFLEGSKNYGLTKIDNEYIGESVIHIGMIIRDELYDNWNDYDVKDEQAASFIVERVTDIAFTIKKKGDAGTYLTFLTKTHNVNEIQHHQSLNQRRSMGDGGKRGMMDIIFGRRR